MPTTGSTYINFKADDKQLYKEYVAGSIFRWATWGSLRLNNFPQLTWAIKLQSLTPKPNLSMSHLLKLSSLNTSFTQLFVDAFIHLLIQQQIFVKHNKLPVLNVGCKSGCPCRRLVGCGSQHDHHCWRVDDDCKRSVRDFQRCW